MPLYLKFTKELYLSSGKGPTYAKRYIKQVIGGIEDHSISIIICTTWGCGLCIGLEFVRCVIAGRSHPRCGCSTSHMHTCMYIYAYMYVYIYTGIRIRCLTHNQGVASSSSTRTMEVMSLLERHLYPHHLFYIPRGNG